MDASTHLVPGGREKTLDGLRGLAAVMVAVAHWFNANIPAPIPPAVGGGGAVAVQIFFVISGYIITTLLLKEERDEGQISIAAFYVRRFFRIVPPLMVYLIALMLLRVSFMGAGLFYLDVRSVAAAGLFVCNTDWLTTCQWHAGHTWSLAVEEQFYILWPLALALVPKRWRVPLLAVFIAWMLTRFLIAPVRNMSNSQSFACIAAGAVYALSPEVKALVKRLGRPLPWVAAVAALIIQMTYAPPEWQAANPALLPVIIFAARDLAWVRAALLFAPIQWLGACSYSLYLWQQLFLGRSASYVDGPPPLILLPLVVAASWLFVERPAIRAGQRLSRYIKGQP